MIYDLEFSFHPATGNCNFTKNRYNFKGEVIRDKINRSSDNIREHKIQELVNQGKVKFVRMDGQEFIYAINIYHNI